MLALRGRSLGLCLVAAALIALSASTTHAPTPSPIGTSRCQCAGRHGRPVADRLDGSSRDGSRRRLRRRELGRQAPRALPGAGAGASTGTRRTPRRQRPPIASCSRILPGQEPRCGAVRGLARLDPGWPGEGRAAIAVGEIAAAAMLAARTGDGRGGAYRFPAPRRAGSLAGRSVAAGAARLR